MLLGIIIIISIEYGYHKDIRSKQNSHSYGLQNRFKDHFCCHQDYELMMNVVQSNV
jgi:hypothetical protein